MYEEKESPVLELKEKINDNFLKTVSAFANYNGGVIVFGVADNGEIIGVETPSSMRLQIENKINDNITPRPIFSIKEIQKEGKTIVELTVCGGKNAPYLYKNNTYKRSDTSSTPADREEIRALYIASMNIGYDQFPSKERNLTFEVLGNALKKEINLIKFNRDILRTLGLMEKDTYLMGAELLSDKGGKFPSETTIVRFGKNISEFMDRADLENMSLLSQYQGALDMFDKWYANYEAVEGFKRVERVQIPREAYREAVANAIVHRDYQMNAAVQISMHADYIEIRSPGGLPKGMTDSAYLYSNLSLPRNIIIAEVFHRLKIIEKFGTGIDRIKSEYAPYDQKPQFEVSSESIAVKLPVISYGLKSGEISLAEQILSLLAENGVLSRLEIEEKTGYKKSSVQNELKRLSDEGKIMKIGDGPRTKYQIKI